MVGTNRREINDCLVRREQVLAVKPFRSYLLVAPVEPAIHEIDLEYFCIVPHRLRVEVSGGDVSGYELGSEEWSPASVALPMPSAVEAVVRRALGGVRPGPSELRMTYRGARRPFAVHELIRTGEREAFNVMARFEATADLTRTQGRAELLLRAVSPLRADNCDATWVDFEAPPELRAQSILLHALNAEAPALRRSLEARLLESARDQLLAGAASRSDRIFERLQARAGTEVLPEARQRLTILIWARRKVKHGAMVARPLSFEVPTLAAIERGQELRRRVSVAGQKLELSLRVGPARGPVIDETWHALELVLRVRSEGGHAQEKDFGTLVRLLRSRDNAFVTNIERSAANQGRFQGAPDSLTFHDPATAEAVEFLLPLPEVSFGPAGTRPEP